MARRWDVATLQRLHILYDRDPRGGEFLHLYTRPFSAGRFFFELTERRDGYSPVRCGKCRRSSVGNAIQLVMYQMVR